LDAKQNVTKCEKNLKVGKFILDKVCKFEYVHELSNEYLQTACPEQVYNGQYTFKRNVTKVDEKTGEVSVVKDKDTGEIVRRKKYMTVDESIEQLDNFLKVMGQPAFSEIDKAIVRSVLEQFTTVDREGKQVVKNPIKKADKECDITYSAMYDGNKHFLTVLKNMADNKRTLWSGSAFYDGKVDTDRIIREHVLDNQPKDIRKQIISNIEDYMTSGTEAEKESVVARNAALEQEVKAMQEANATFASRDGIDDEKREKAKTVINSRMAALKQRAAKAEEAVAAGKSVTTIPVKENTEEKTENKVLKADVRTIKPNEDSEETVDKTPAD
jgi:hypothetical protein